MTDQPRTCGTRGCGLVEVRRVYAIWLEPFSPRSRGRGLCAAEVGRSSSSALSGHGLGQGLGGGSGESALKPTGERVREPGDWNRGP